jgi:uncharacterized protein (DUF952 family)
MRAIYKVCDAAEWTKASRIGTFAGSDVDRRDGFELSMAMLASSSSSTDVFEQRSLWACCFPDHMQTW